MQALNELLQTEDEEEQVKRVGTLLQVVNQQPLSMTILYIPATRSTEVAFVGQMAPDQAHFLLDQAKRAVIKMELESEQRPENQAGD